MPVKHRPRCWLIEGRWHRVADASTVDDSHLNTLTVTVTSPHNSGESVANCYEGLGLVATD